MEWSFSRYHKLCFPGGTESLPLLVLPLRHRLTTLVTNVIESKTLSQIE